jgi:hypothetical protein
MPFFESAEAATKHAIDMCGKGIKDVAKAVFPGKTLEAAATALRNALNENRDERLTAGQHIFIANYTGRYDWLYFVANECSHSRPQLIAPEDANAELQRMFIESVQQQRQLMDRMEANIKRTAGRK